jgi:hypothetical protein
MMQDIRHREDWHAQFHLGTAEQDPSFTTGGSSERSFSLGIQRRIPIAIEELLLLVRKGLKEQAGR